MSSLAKYYTCDLQNIDTLQQKFPLRHTSVNNASLYSHTLLPFALPSGQVILGNNLINHPKPTLLHFPFPFASLYVKRSWTSCFSQNILNNISWLAPKYSSTRKPSDTIGRFLSFQDKLIKFWCKQPLKVKVQRWECGVPPNGVYWESPLSLSIYTSGKGSWGAYSSEIPHATVLGALIAPPDRRWGREAVVGVWALAGPLLPPPSAGGLGAWPMSHPRWFRAQIVRVSRPFRYSFAQFSVKLCQNAPSCLFSTVFSCISPAK